MIKIALAVVGGVTLFMGLMIFIVHLVDLFERVDTLEGKLNEIKKRFENHDKAD